MTVRYDALLGKGCLKGDGNDELGRAWGATDESFARSNVFMIVRIPTGNSLLTVVGARF